MDKHLAVMKRASIKGGEVLKYYFGKNLKVIDKTRTNDFKTIADDKSEKEIIKILSKNFPEYNIIAEEIGEIRNGSDYTFVIDPLDGSYNFVLGLPDFSVSIALFHKKEIICGSVYCPMTDCLYYAQKNKGAYLNNKKLKINQIDKINLATVIYACGYDYSSRQFVKIFKNLELAKVKRYLNNWSVATDLCLVAAGKVEAMINNGDELYDYAAGKLIAREAGALITDLKGKKEKSDINNKFLVSNGTAIHNKIIKLL